MATTAAEIFRKLPEKIEDIFKKFKMFFSFFLEVVDKRWYIDLMRLGPSSSFLPLKSSSHSSFSSFPLSSFTPFPFLFRSAEGVTFSSKGKILFLLLLLPLRSHFSHVIRGRVSVRKMAQSTVGFEEEEEIGRQILD